MIRTHAALRLEHSDKTFEICVKFGMPNVEGERTKCFGRVIGVLLLI